MIYWEGVGVYGSGGGGPIVVLWRRSKIIMVDGGELKNGCRRNTAFLTVMTCVELWKPIYHMKAHAKTNNMVYLDSLY